MKFSLALIATIATTEATGESTYLLNKVIRLNVDDVLKNEIDEAVITAIKGSSDLSIGKVMVFIADGDLHENWIGLHRVNFFNDGEITRSVIASEEPSESQIHINDVFNNMMADFESELALNKEDV